MEFSANNIYSNPSDQSTPITKERFEVAMKEVKKSLDDFTQGFMLERGAEILKNYQTIEESKAQLVETRIKINEAQIMQEEAQKMQRISQAKLDFIQEKENQLDQKWNELEQKRLEAVRKKEISLQRLAEIAQKRNENALGYKAEIFYAIFHKPEEAKNLAQEKINQLLDTYLNDDSLSVGENEERVLKVTINSMQGIIKYLIDNPTVKKCNFIIIKNKISDVPTLSQYLAHPGCKVTSIGFKTTTLSQDDISSLNEAVAARKGRLKITYR